MAVELRVPQVGESITEVEIGEWLKGEGDEAKLDESVVSLESEKATVELLAPVAGTVTQILKKTGETAAIGELIGYMEEGGKAAPAKGAAKSANAEKATPVAFAKAPPTKSESAPSNGVPSKDAIPAKEVAPARVMPAAARELAEHGLRAEEVAASGPGGRLLKEDVQRFEEAAEGTGKSVRPNADTDKSACPIADTETGKSVLPTVGGEDEIVPMTFLRRKIAERLVEAQHTAALLTTFNEIDMSALMELRKRHQEVFTKRYGTKLGFMSFFVKAAVDALKQVPQVNAEIRGKDIVYHNYFDIGVAVGGGKGLVVPVLRRAERLSFAQIEVAIGDLAKRAQDNKLLPDELMGGTFTISNGGVYGSLLSTPIVNPPQSGILGMHSIQDRPMALNGQVVICPMMYIALTYDHRIVDGREAVTFLKRIKECIEAPERILLEV